MSASDKITIGLFLFFQTVAAVKYFMRLEKRLDKIEYQLYENGGSSMKDQMNNVCNDVQELRINQAIIQTIVKTKLGE